MQWNDYSSSYSKWAASYSKAESRMKFKQLIKEEAAKEFTPIDVKVNRDSTLFLKRRRMGVYINENELSKYNSESVVKKLVSLYDKIPYNSDYIDDGIIKYLTIKDTSILKYKIAKEIPDEDVLKAVDEYDVGRITYADLRKLLKKAELPKTFNVGGNSEGGYKGGGRVGSLVIFDDVSLYKKALRVIQSRVKPKSIVSFEESYRKGKRINRNFINGNSMKPLISKSVETKKKKKIFFILDCSGSMGEGSSSTDPSHKAVSFAAACVNSGVFECDHVIYHSSLGWENVAKRIKKGEIFNLAGPAEGFEYIDDNLDSQWLVGVDYIVVLTDLNIGSSAEEGLANYLKKGKRHMILSFQSGGTLKGINVRKISKMSDMINSIVTLVGN